MLPTCGGTCKPGLSLGIYAGLLGGVSGGCGEVGGFGITSVGAIIVVMNIRKGEDLEGEIAWRKMRWTVTRQALQNPSIWALT